MFAVFKSGGKQYKVAAGDVLKVEKLEGEKGAVVVFDNILAVGDANGLKAAGSTKVSAEIINQTKDDKVLIFKKKRRHNYRRKRGHRQPITWVKIQEIGEGLKAKAAAPKAESKTEAKAAAPKKAAAKKPAADKQ
ncbi:MAG: 50S ribosomal protein L21 [Proteobacteria bacterium]|nr:50S ribosomal protein L21 [Pseudomonadota bacterium]